MKHSEIMALLQVYANQSAQIAREIKNQRNKATDIYKSIYHILRNTQFKTQDDSIYAQGS